MEKLHLGVVAIMFKNFKEHSLEMYFKQIFWEYRNMKWSPYMYLEEHVETAVLDRPTKVPLEIDYVLRDW